jgi:toxin ParE1/3/4
VSLYRLTPAAQRDLSEIWDFTEQEWGVRQAETYLEDIKGAVERVAAIPDRGRSCDEVRAGYRVYPSGKHLIFYIPRDSGVDIIRILHQRMDPSRHL